MNINQVTANDAALTVNKAAKQYKPVYGTLSTNSVFRSDSLSLGNVDSPYQTYSTNNIASAYSATPATRANQPFNISNYYTMPPKEASQMLRLLQEEIFNTDFSDMSGLETYEYIESKYIEAFGKDFLVGSHLLGPVYVSGSNLSEADKENTNYAYVRIGQDFYAAVYYHTLKDRISEGSFFDINRKRLYGDMSNGEIMDAVKAKYPQPLNNRSLALIEGDLYSIGITSIGVGAYAAALILRPGEDGTYDTVPPWTVLEERWTKLLDDPADLQLLCAVNNELLSDAPDNPWFLQIRDLIAKLGATIGSDGLLQYDATDSFLDALERHDKNLRDMRELTEKNSVIRENGAELSTDTEELTILSGER